jgi:hypothetical protein
LPKRLLSFLSFFRYREPHASLLQLPRVEPRAHRGLETHKGRDDPTAQAVFQEIRNIAINLANDLSKFDVALSITKACREVFAKLPRAVQQLNEDQATLEERIVYSKVNPLAIVIGEFGDDLHKLVSDLRRGGFGRGSTGSAKALRDAFVTAVKSAKGSTVADLPWLMLRSITVKLNNELEAPDSALALVTGLLDLARELEVSEDVFSRVREDKRAIERNQLEAELVGHLKEGRSYEPHSRHSPASPSIFRAAKGRPKQPILGSAGCNFEPRALTAETRRMTGALLDRLSHHVHILSVNGESYRLKTS